MIICDDFSTDATYKIMKSYALKDNRIIILKNERNLGLAASLNKCINISKGEYIARMDDDDISHKDRFEKQVQFLEKNHRYSIVGTSRNTFDNQGVWNTFGQGRELTKEDIIKCKIFYTSYCYDAKKSIGFFWNVYGLQKNYKRTRF